jgi:hypothetical protein
MTKILKRRFLLSTVLFSLLLVSCVHLSLPSLVYAAEETIEEKGLTILNDVVGLNITKYVVTTKEYPQNYNSSYLGVVPLEDVGHEFISEGSKVKALCTFANSRLQMLHILENEGSPHMSEAAANSIELAKSFLTNYQAYTSDSLYGELSSTLDNVDAGTNVTKTSGNTQLEVMVNNGYTTFKWTYTFNNAVAPSKFVALGFKNGFLTCFVDNWQLYNIGSTSVNLSKEEAAAIALETAKTYASTKLDAYAFEAQNLNESNIRWASLIFDSSLEANKTRNEDPLMLYPVWRVGIALDKWYGHLYGIAVDIWADTKEVRCAQEAWSTLPPPEGVPTADMSAVGESTSEAPNAGTINTFDAELNLIMYLVFPILSTVIAGTVSFWMHKKKKSCTCNLPKPRFLRTGGILLCTVILSIALLAPIATVNATLRAGVVWGSESDGAIDPATGESWRKSQTEIEYQDEIANDIEWYFSQGGYIGFNHQGDRNPGSKKSDVLTYIHLLSGYYDVMAVVDFDHGVGRDDYSGDNDVFHFMFEDNNGTIGGPDWEHRIEYPENGVYDMDIYSNLTDPSKVAFAFINTCYSANLTHPATGAPWQGLFNNKARGMPFAWTGRTVMDRDTPGFTPSLNMGSDGYNEPDEGSQVYIGFPWGSASLEQPIPWEDGTEEYHSWVDQFFRYALLYDLSVNMALDHASWKTWGDPFGGCPLMNFTCYWWNANPETMPDCNMTVYGNGNVQLRYYIPGWNDNFDDNSMDTSKWEELEVNGAQAFEILGQLLVSVPSGSGWAQAGYVTKSYYNIKDCKITITVSDFSSLDEMTLQICNTKTTSSDPFSQSNWYRILKARYDSNIYVQNRINGVLSTKVVTTWTAATGNLSIDICDGAIAFYENGNMRYAEPYALPSYNCYIYVFTSTDKSRASGVDKFDDFTLAPTPSFWDYFGDADNTWGWTISQGSWTISNEKLTAHQGNSLIRTNQQFTTNRHVRAEVRTLSAGDDTWEVAWVMVKYVDASNMIYSLLHTNGGVELAIIKNGQKIMRFGSSQLSPYNVNAIDVSIIGTKAMVWINGQLYIDTSHDWFDDFGGYTACWTENSLAEFDNIVVLDE